MPNRIALFPGTFDPFTLGHLDIAERAARLFDQVVIAVGINEEKSALLSLEERLDLIRRSTAHLEKVRVESFDGLVADYATGIGSTAIVRGLRQSGDFEYETRMAFANKRLAPGLETVLLPSSPHVALISSTIVRDVYRWGGDVSSFVPAVVADALNARRPS